MLLPVAATVAPASAATGSTSAARRVAGLQGGLHPAVGRVPAARAGAASTVAHAGAFRAGAGANCRSRWTARAQAHGRRAGALARRRRPAGGAARQGRAGLRRRRRRDRPRGAASSSAGTATTVAARAAVGAAQRQPGDDAAGAVVAAGAQAVRAALCRSASWPPIGGTRRLRRAASADGAIGRRARRCWLSLALAFVGGLLLNLMPCVFPVLSLKVLGFANHAGSSAGSSWPAAWPTPPAWCCRSSRWPALLLALRAAGDQLGWGFQLQSPLFVAALALLFALIGLNLLGVFEFPACCRAARCAAQPPPGGRPWAHRRARGGGGIALHRAVHGRRARRRADAADAAGAGRLCGAGRSAWRAVSGGQPVAGLVARAAAAGRVDGALQDRDGVPDVRHRGLAGVGARPAGRHRRRRRAAGAAGGARVRALGARGSGARRRRAGSLSRRGGGRRRWRRRLGRGRAAAASSTHRPVAASAARHSRAVLAALVAGRVAHARAPKAGRCSSTSPRPGA